MSLQVELIYDIDCPNLSEARKLLLHAFADAGLKPTWREFNSQAVDSPSHAKNYGSPTILVNGKDVAEANNGSGSDCCRLYTHQQGLRGVPQLSQVVYALKQATPIPLASKFHWRHFLATLPSLAALLPVLQCPACWPAYAGILTFLGFGFLYTSTYLFPITGTFLVLALFTLGYRARARQGYLPLLLGLVSVTGILVGKFVIMFGPAVYLGLALLFVASIWNAWPRKKSPTAKD